MTNLNLTKSDILDIADGLRLKKANLIAQMSGASDSDRQWLLGQVKNVNAILKNLNKSSDFYVPVGFHSYIA